MNDKKKQFFKVPQDIKTMTDEQLDQWADEIYQALFEEQKTNKKIKPLAQLLQRHQNLLLQQL